MSRIDMFSLLSIIILFYLILIDTNCIFQYLKAEERLTWRLFVEAYFLAISFVVPGLDIWMLHTNDCGSLFTKKKNNFVLFICSFPDTSLLLYHLFSASFITFLLFNSNLVPRVFSASKVPSRRHTESREDPGEVVDSTLILCKRLPVRLPHER